jgi:hypothetical protein
MEFITTLRIGIQMPSRMLDSFFIHSRNESECGGDHEIHLINEILMHFLFSFGPVKMNHSSYTVASGKFT